MCRKREGARRRGATQNFSQSLSRRDRRCSTEEISAFFAFSYLLKAVQFGEEKNFANPVCRIEQNSNPACRIRNFLSLWVAYYRKREGARRSGRKTEPSLKIFRSP